MLQIKETEEYVLHVDCGHIWEYNQQLYRQITNYPSEMIPILDVVANQVYREQILQGQRGIGGASSMQVEAGESGEDDELQIIQIRPFNLRSTHNIREFGPTNIDKLVQLKGIVIRCSDVIPEMKSAYFRCDKCNKFVELLIDRARITEPDVCSNCQGK